jgi:hypothetical protein
MVSFGIAAVEEARAIAVGRLWLRFTDGATGTVDLAPSIPARFVELRDAGYFAGVQLIGGGVGWPNGFDCAPEWLRDQLAEDGTGAERNDDDWVSLRRHAAGMPEISRFFGMVIRMFYSDHARPHFHAEYGEYAISLEIDGAGIHGRFPSSRLPMLFEWRDQHRDELMANWDRLRRGEPPQPISPLL